MLSANRFQVLLLYLARTHTLKSELASLPTSSVDLVTLGCPAIGRLAKKMSDTPIRCGHPMDTGVFD
jgi:hypothetical protein